jgi:hypothetical protein
MNLVPSARRFRPFLILAPAGANLTHFGDVSRDRIFHESILAEVQRFRGRVYVAENNLNHSDLLPDGRHVQAADDKSWHLLSLTPAGEVVSCGRLCVHDENVGFSELMVSHSALAHSPIWGNAVRQAGEAELGTARRRQVRFGELGGWAIEPGLRCSTEAIRMLLAGFSLAEVMGGMAGISTVNLRHSSASILRRIGGRPLVAGGTELPPYYEPRYSSELEILRFDSAWLNPRYTSRVRECCAELRNMTVICPEPATNTRKTSPEHLGARRSETPLRDWPYVPGLASA